MPSHWTGSTSWRASRAVTSAAEASGAAVTLEYTGMRGAATLTSASTCSRKHPLLLLGKRAAPVVPAALNGLRAGQRAPLLIVAVLAVASLLITCVPLLEPYNPQLVGSFTEHVTPALKIDRYYRLAPAVTFRIRQCGTKLPLRSLHPQTSSVLNNGCSSKKLRLPSQHVNINPGGDVQHVRNEACDAAAASSVVSGHVHLDEGLPGGLHEGRVEGAADSQLHGFEGSLLHRRRRHGVQRRAVPRHDSPLPPSRFMSDSVTSM